ncbi:hypothetical protein J6590_004982 [Homalodisca vitripennis]|nr:hypothetical protein J6590_004982 [Homalodisca vitripennis]
MIHYKSKAVHITSRKKLGDYEIASWQLRDNFLTFYPVTLAAGVEHLHQGKVVTLSNP